MKLHWVHYRVTKLYLLRDKERVIDQKHTIALKGSQDKRLLMLKVNLQSKHEILEQTLNNNNKCIPARQLLNN